MQDHTYKIIELAGSSETSIEDAVQRAIARASQTLNQLRWLEVVQTRGHYVLFKLNRHNFDILLPSMSCCTMQTGACVPAYAVVFTFSHINRRRNYAMTAFGTRPISARNTIVALMACVALLWAPSADAGPVVYTVNQTIGAGSATGTITTDGTIGTLGAVDIIGWDLDLYDGLNRVVRASSTPGNIVHVAGGALTASLATLTFNYSAVDSSDFYFGNTPILTGELCYTSYSNCWGPAGVGVYDVGGDQRSVYIAQTGSQIIASGGTPVPEPSTLALFGVGLAGVARFRRHRTAKAPPDAAS